MGNKPLFCFWYLSLWVKEERKYPALWTAMPSILSPEVENSHMNVVCLPILKVWERVILGQKGFRCGALVSWIQITDIQPHLSKPYLCYSGDRSFCLSFSNAKVLPFLETFCWWLGRGGQQQVYHQEHSQTLQWEYPSVLLMIYEYHIGFKNLAFLRYLAGTFEFWCCMKVGCWMLCSHSNAETVVLCAGSCVIHSWESNQGKTGKSYIVLVLWGSLLCPFLLQVIVLSGVTVLVWTHLVFWLFCSQLTTGEVSWLCLTTAVYLRRRI